MRRKREAEGHPSEGYLPLEHPVCHAQVNFGSFAYFDSTFFGQMPVLWQRHLQATQGAERKSALLLLSEIVQEGNDGLCDEVLRLASQQGLADTESIRQCYYFISRAEFHPQPLQLAQALEMLDFRPVLSAYDALGMVVSA